MAFLIMENVPVNPWFNISNAQCFLNELPDGDPTLPPPLAGFNIPPQNMQKDQELHVNFRWTQTGFFSGADLRNVIEFELKFLLEAKGSAEVPPGLDQVNTVQFKFPGGAGHTYDPGNDANCRIVYPADSIPVGTYNCTAVFQVAFKQFPNEKYYAGYAEFPVLNVYSATV